MANVRNNGNGGNQGQQQEEPREKKVLEMEQNVDFSSLTESILCKSTDFCQLVSDVLIDVFADFEGCRMDMDPTTNSPTLTLVFNHLEKPNCTLPYVCTKDIDAKTSNDVIRRFRNLQHRTFNGDTYNLTQDGKDMLEQFIMNIPKTRNVKDGSIKWNELLQNTVDPAAQMRNQQYTLLSFIDINLMAKFLYGAKTNCGGNWIYTNRIVRSVPIMSSVPGQRVFNRDFVMEIKRIRENEVMEQARRLGFGVNMNGLDIVRAAEF